MKLLAEEKQMNDQFGINTHRRKGGKTVPTPTQQLSTEQRNGFSIVLRLQSGWPKFVKVKRKHRKKVKQKQIFEPIRK